ncbi:hemolysin XhlA family protein [Heyndrickxia sporothermodurans]|uniref:hemolysin XhlA family protein n=1 Tax=Heyndrickxia sporothermodurans TaxID=46224 RepID=UPI00082617A1|nr:hemolysin XhlA family protein [Heyndrickxia sporothermodurans]
MDIWQQSIQKDIDDLKKEQSDIKSNIKKLQEKELIQDYKIGNIEEKLQDIKDDTKWLRRAITNSLIVALVGGAVAIFFAAIKNF